jgi:hypothetical protein
MRDERMDPDLVRQQAEEEAASRRRIRRDMAPQLRREPVLPMGGEPQRPERPVWIEDVARRSERASHTAMLGWGAALGIAASATLGTMVGIIGGMMLGVKLQLVPLQTVLIGTGAGLVLGWQVGALALRQRAGLGWWRAYSVGARVVFVVLVVLAAAMFVLPHFTGSAPAPNAGFDIAVFWKSVAAGAAVALVLGALAIRRALRND